MDRACGSAAAHRAGERSSAVACCCRALTCPGGPGVRAHCANAASRSGKSNCIPNDESWRTNIAVSLRPLHPRSEQTCVLLLWREGCPAVFAAGRRSRKRERQAGWQAMRSEGPVRPCRGLHTCVGGGAWKPGGLDEAIGEAFLGMLTSVRRGGQIYNVAKCEEKWQN